MSVFSNLESLLRLFGTFDGSRFANAGDALSLFDGGTDSAYENYALLNPSIKRGESETIRLVDCGVEFFALKNRSHIWPLFGEIDETLARALEARGVTIDSVFTDMTADSSAMEGIAVRECAIVETAEKTHARRWADAAWLGFDSGEPAPESFVRFAASMINCPDIAVYSLKTDDSPGGEIAATGVLANVAGTAGIYYVSTRPEFRGMGLAKSLMKSLMSRANAEGYREVSLLATPSGAPLYRKCGFADTGEVRIGVLGEA